MAAMVVYGTNIVNAADTTAESQTAADGDFGRGMIARNRLENGNPPSRAKANVMREQEVSAARPQRYCEVTMPMRSVHASQPGKTDFIIQWTTSAPFSTPSRTPGSASRIAQIITHPNSPDTQ